MKPYLSILCGLILLFLASCNGHNPYATVITMDTTDCGCRLTTEEMINKCPVKAVGDSVVICKAGTINVLGSGMEPMRWPEYMASKYIGAEGALTDCKSGKYLFYDLHTSPILTYRKGRILVDKRMSFDVYDAATNTWLERIELPVWRTIVYAVQDQVHLSPDTLIFKPTFCNAKAFASATATYNEEVKRTDHYLYMRTANRLLACGLCGDTASERRLLGLQQQFARYFYDHPESQQYLDEKITLYKAYKTFLYNGGKRTFFDLSIFPYFQKQMKKGTVPAATMKPLEE